MEYVIAIIVIVGLVIGAKALRNPKRLVLGAVVVAGVAVAALSAIGSFTG